MSIGILPHKFWSSYKHLIHYSSEDSQVIKWLYKHLQGIFEVMYNMPIVNVRSSQIDNAQSTLSQRALKLLELLKADNILWLKDWRWMQFRPEWREFDWKWTILDWNRYFKGHGGCCIKDSIEGDLLLLILVMVWHSGLGTLMGLLVSLFCNGFVMSTEALTIHGNGCKYFYLQNYICVWQLELGLWYKSIQKMMHKWQC